MKRRSIATALLFAAIMAFGMGTYAEENKTAPEEAQGKKQTTCPVMTGNKINPKLYTDVKGKRIYVCCAGCIAKIKAEPEKYIKQMEAEGIVLEKPPEAEEAKAE